MYFKILFYNLNKQSMHINNLNCLFFFGPYPFIWSTLMAPTNMSVKLRKHNAEATVISDIFLIYIMYYIVLISRD